MKRTNVKGLFLILTVVLLSVFSNADAQRYRNKSNLGNEEMVKFVALKNGDIVEFNWVINSTRIIKTIELRKGSMNSNSIEWETVKTITNEDKKYIDYLPDLGKVFYKLILTDDSGVTSEYEPEFRLKKDGDWELAPAYDLCHAYRPDSIWVSQHALSINGKRKDISRDDLMTFAKSMNIKKADEIITESNDIVLLWNEYAEETKVNTMLRNSIQETLLNMGNEKNSTTSKVPDTDTYAHMLYLSNFLREPTIPSAIEALQLPPGSLGLDAGCGIGSHTLLLAEAVAPAGHVTGLDLSPEFLIHAKQIAERSGLSEQVSFREGDLNKLPFDDDTIGKWGTVIGK